MFGLFNSMWGLIRSSCGYFCRIAFLPSPMSFPLSLTVWSFVHHVCLIPMVTQLQRWCIILTIDYDDASLSLSPPSLAYHLCQCFLCWPNHHQPFWWWDIQMLRWHKPSFKLSIIMVWSLCFDCIAPLMYVLYQSLEFVMPEALFTSEYIYIY